MTRVLVLAYYFPPIGGAGAQRPAKLVRYLPSYGIEPIVVTGPGPSEGRWTPADESLSAEVAATTVVHRVPGPEPPGAGGWRGRGERWLEIRPRWSSWWVDGVVELGREMTDIDIVYAWMSPYESAVAAMRLSQALGRPWVADLGDPWALDEMTVFPSAVHRRLELRRMRRLLASAAAIVMSTPEAVRRVRETFPELAGKSIVSIPNGFDAADFEESVDERSDGIFRIVHTGYLHTELGRRQRQMASVRQLLGGATRGVDILTRSHVYLLEAVDRLVARDPELQDRIEVHLAGVLSRADQEIAARSKVVRLHGYLPHADSLRLIRSADLLFLPMQNLPAGMRSSTVPGKTYEYLASGRPILAAVPEGDARDILTAAGRAHVCRPDDVEGLIQAVEATMKDPSAASAPQNTAIAPNFEYRRLASALGTVFQNIHALQEGGLAHHPAAAQPMTGCNDTLRRKTALHLAYFFPPIGGAGAQRSLKLIRYLSEFAYDSIVVSGPGAPGGRWTPADESLSAEVAATTVVHRVPGPEPPGAGGWRRRGERWLEIRPRWSSWWIDGATTVGANLHDVDVIVASMSPYESASVAMRLSQALGRPWVADLRDPWALDEMTVFPSAVHRRLELRRMRRLLGSAAAIVMKTPEAVRRVRETFPELAGKSIVSIPNGFDAADFEESVDERSDGIFRIVHTGYLHTELGRRQRQMASVRQLLGGATRGVDILTRSHVYLLEAVDRLVARDPELQDRIEVHLAGVLSRADQEIAARSKVVRLHGYLPHADSLRLIRSADLLFLPMQNLPAGMRSSTVPGKTYEYLASGRPILAAVPEGDARDILTASGKCRLATPDDPDSIAAGIAAEIAQSSAGLEPSTTEAQVVERYGRHALAAEFAAVLDAITDLAPPSLSRVREDKRLSPEAAVGMPKS